MVEYLGLIQLAGKYVFLAALYVFLIWIFRSLFATLRVEEGSTQSPQKRGAQRTEPSTSQQKTRSRAAKNSESRQESKKSADRSQQRASKPRLVVTEPGDSDLEAGAEFPLTAAVTIGRAEENSIPIPDRYVSGQHAIIFRKDDRRILRDRDSTNGTTRNGTPIDQDVVLNDGDTVGIGTAKLEYHSGR